MYNYKNKIQKKETQKFWNNKMENKKLLIIVMQVNLIIIIANIEKK